MRQLCRLLVICFINSAPFIFKFWAPTFDAIRERSDVVLVWVHLSSLPTHIQNPQSFVNLGNNIGSFLKEDYSFEELRDLSVACILVSLDFHKKL